MAREYKQLKAEERSVIVVGLEQGLSRRAIARLLRRPASAVSREILRNGRHDRYDAIHAAHLACRRRRRPRHKLKQNPQLWQAVVTGLRKNWSPQQIAGTLRRMHPDDPEHRVCHETIYATIYAWPRGELRTELISHLRRARKKRRPRARGKDRRGQLQDFTPIAMRPQEVESRTVPGHWEGDVLKGKGSKSLVGSLVERSSRFLILVKLDNATAPVVHQGFVREMKPVPEILRRSLTYDRGPEMARHKNVAADLKLTVYFADPHAPWQRGTNENTNGLVRQYLPKGTDLSGYSQEELNAIAAEINERPRKTHGFRSPAEVYCEFIDAYAKNKAVGVALQS
jgi:IS30 family transposase